jgi:DNA phosphorothioation-dependent restriction protein DptH
MLNQYYDFLVNKLLGWLENEKLNPGDRFYLILNNQGEVNSFVDSLKRSSSEQFYSFNLENEGISYKTISYEINGIKVVFANTATNVTQDFLVTLRNRVGQQNGIWQDTVLIFICNDVLDSIVGGSTSLMKVGNPFHIQTMRKNLTDEIKKASLSEANDKILRHMVMEKFSDEQTKLTLLDFASVYSLLNKKVLELSDFNELGYFYDRQLETFKDNGSIEKRLEMNSQIYQKIEDIHNHENVRDRLEDIIEGESLINDLEKEHIWREIDFETVKKGLDSLKASKGIKIEFAEDNLSKVNPDLVIWDRKNSDFGSNTAAKKKQHNLIIFAEPSAREVVLRLPFDSNVQKSSVSDAGSYLIVDNHKQKLGMEYEARGKTLIVTIPDYDMNRSYMGIIVYRHKAINSLTFKFSFMLSSWTPKMLFDIQTLFCINIKPKYQYLELTENIDTLQIGDGENIEKGYVTQKGEKFRLNSNNTLVLDLTQYEFESDQELQKSFTLAYGNIELPFFVSDEKAVNIPKSAVAIDKARREKNEHIIYTLNQLKQATSTYYPFNEYKEALKLEADLVNNKYLSAELDEGTLIEMPLEVPEKVKEKYQQICDYVIKNQTLVSLACFNDEFSRIVTEYVYSVWDVMRSLEENKTVPNEKRNLFYLGTIREKKTDRVMLSPLNPMLLAYQYSLHQKVGQEDLPENIISKLNCKNLIPFFSKNNNLYESYYDKGLHRWLFYYPVENKKAKLSTFTRSIVYTKLADFHAHFIYLFNINPGLGMNIRVVNVIDEIEILRGISRFILEQIKKRESLEIITAVNVFITGEHNEYDSNFKQFFQIEDVEMFNDFIGDNIKKYSKRNFTDTDVMDAVKRNINVYYQDIEEQYYHVTFYKFKESPASSANEIYQLERNYAIDGLISGNKFTSLNGHYANGFGSEENPSSKLIEFAIDWNSLVASLSNSGFENYRNGETIVNNVYNLKELFAEENFSDIFDSSNWVSFINPNVDLSYFNEKENDLYVIHYSDQSNTQTYESITVTKNIEQYKQILRESLQSYSRSATSMELENTIRSFNLLNGEWLLRIIGEKSRDSNVVREKLSIISAYKNILGILNRDNFYWIPISMEEIIRVSRMIGLDSSSDLFSTKMLNYSGRTSDDLLFMGLEISEGNNLKMHFLPVEVKVGKNAETVISKAKEQVQQTASILRAELINDGDPTFKKRFFRNFFVQIFITNANKIVDNQLWTEKKYEELKKIYKDLLDDNFDISTGMDDIYGMGMIASFKANTSFRKIVPQKGDGVTIIEFNEMDAYEDIKASIADIKNEIIKGKRGFDLKYILENQHIDSTEIYDHKRVVPVEEKGTEDDFEFKESQSKTPDPEEHHVESIVIEKECLQIDSEVSDENQTKETNISKLDNINVLLGQIEGTNKNIYWEYGNKQLANRHLIITGKSGQGKTYFMQCLLYELSKNNVSSVVIDYTNGFIPNQLEPIFKGKMGSKLVNHIIYTQNLPINPFKRFDVDLGIGMLLPQSEDDMVDRVVQVLDFVFDLGIQQRFSLKQVIHATYEIYGEDMTFTKIKEKLQSDESADSKKLLGRIDTLLSRDPFSYQNRDFEWNQIFNNKGEVHIFQLTGLQPQLQKVLTEFLLWDMYNYSMLNGSKDSPLPILLDEAQNLNHKESSPTTKILKEGRKFGWSAWFATQSLSSIKNAGGELSGLYNAQEQIHFLPTEDQLGSVAKSVSGAGDQKFYEKMLSNLNKGEAVVYGPVLNSYGELNKVIEKIQVTSLEER